MTATTGGDRAKRRERERKARQRRAVKKDHMQDKLKGLEASVLAVRTLDDTVWERFLNPTAMRARHMLLLAKEARSLMAEQAQLHRLLQEHRLSSTVIATMLTDHPSSEWERDVKRWRALSRRSYVPWTLDACQPEIDAAMKELNAFHWSTGKTTTGHQFLGWSDSQRVDSACGVFQYQFHKTFRGFEMMDLVNVGWDIYTDERTFQDVVIGPRSLGSLEVLQQLTPNLVIVHGFSRFPSIIGNIHRTYLVSRVKTERGLTQCVRSICCPDLIRAFQDPTDVWTSNFQWLLWERLDDEQKGYTLRVGGSFRSVDVAYLQQWMAEMFGCMLRAERLGTRTQLLMS